MLNLQTLELALNVQSSLWNCALVEPSRFEKIATSATARLSTARSRSFERQNSAKRKAHEPQSRALSLSAGRSTKPATSNQSATSSSSSRASSQCSSTSGRAVAPRKIRRTMLSQQSGSRVPAGQQPYRTSASRMASGPNAMNVAAATAAPVDDERAAAGSQTQLLALARMQRQYGLQGELGAAGHQVEPSGSASDMETEVGDMVAAEEIEEAADGDESGDAVDESDESGSQSETHFVDGDENNEVPLFQHQLPTLPLRPPQTDAQLEQFHLLRLPKQPPSQLLRSGDCSHLQYYY